MAEITWIKLKTDIYRDNKLKIIRTMGNGDKVAFIWVMLMALAGETNDEGYVYLGGGIPYTDEMLSTVLNETVDNIRLSLNALKQFRMIEEDEKGIYLVNFQKHQSVTKMNDVKEYNRKKKQESRERLAKNASQEMSTKCQPNVNHVNENVNTDIDKEKDKEIDKKKKKIKELEPTKDIVEILDYMNLICKKNFKSTTKTTIQHIENRIKEGYTVAEFKRVIEIKSAEWLNDTEMNVYLRPETLFGNKFESYLNSKPKGESKDGIRTTSKYGDGFDPTIQYSPAELTQLNKRWDLSEPDEEINF